MNTPKMHVLTAQQFKDPNLLYGLFRTADTVSQILTTDSGAAYLEQLLKGGIMYEVFYEESSRTRFSFWSAANMLGMHICYTEDAKRFSSAAKGESLEHTIRALAGQRV